MKRCTGCGVGKSTSEFYKHPNGKHGLHPRCKDCLKAYALERRDTAIGRTYNSRYCDSHKDEKRNYNRTYKKTFMGSLRIRFANMKTRCGNKNCLRYKDYGGRGIECKFGSFDEFADYVLNILKVDPCGLQIDRIDNDGNYEPGNIRFVTAKVNNNNKRNSKHKF